MRRLLIALLLLASVRAHSTNFTDVTAWGYYTSNSVINELVVSIREHQRLLMQTEAPGFVGRGSYVPQQTNFWRSMQNWVSNNAPNFLDTEEIESTDIPFAPSHTWQTVLDNIDRTNGFRRATFYDPDIHDWTDPRDIMWTDYPTTNGWGFIEGGDIVGPWLLDDLQLALWEERLIKWNVGTGLDEELAGTNGAGWGASGGALVNSSDSYTTQLLNWAAAGWTNQTNNLLLYAVSAAIDYSAPFSTWAYLGGRQRNSTIVLGYSDALNDMGHTADVYYQPLVWRAGPTNQVGHDFDSQGWTFNGQYYRWEGWTNQAAYTSTVMQFDFSDPQPNPVKQAWPADPNYTATHDTNLNSQVRALRIIFTPVWLFNR